MPSSGRREYHRQYRAKNPDKVAEYRLRERVASRERYAALPPEAKAAKQAKKREYMRRWHAANPEKSKAQARAWGAANRAHVNEMTGRWRARNRDRVKAARRAAYERKKALGVSIRSGSKEMRETIIVELLRRDGFNCGICATGLTGTFQFDHVLAVKDGGNHCLENLRLAHADCNSARNRLVAA